MTKELYILRITEVAKKLSIGKSTIYDWLNPKSPRHDPTFPKPLKLGASSIGWISAQLDQWLLDKHIEQHPEMYEEDHLLS